MRPRAALLLLSLSLCACAPTEESHMKAIIGAVLIDGLGGPPLSDSVVVVAGDRIREAVLAVGFKVEYRKVPTEVTVVDHCERPSEN